MGNQIEHNQSGLCECGCGRPIRQIDAGGRAVRFLRGHKHRRYEGIWTPERWNDAYVVTKDQARAVVYRPDYPKADGSGRALRAHVVWWLNHERVAPDGHVIHHINHNAMDDRPENLLLMTISDHSTHHHEKNPPSKQICPQCNSEFTIQFNIISQHLKEGREYGQRFCSTTCAAGFRKGKRGHSPNGLTPSKVREIRSLLKDAPKHSSRTREVADLFGISVRSVYAIKSRQNWSDVDD